MHIFATDLPSADSPTVVLAQATEEEKLAQWRKNGVSWKGVLSDEAYLRREDHLAKQRLTRDGGLSFWVLVDSSCEPRRVLAGCESFKKKALVARNGRVEQAVAHGIGSVFCASEMRRRGYAARMLRDLGVKLRTWQTDQYPCLFSVLYSDIGKVSCFIRRIRSSTIDYMQVHTEESMIVQRETKNHVPEKLRLNRHFTRPLDGGLSVPIMSI